MAQNYNNSNQNELNYTTKKMEKIIVFSSSKRLRFCFLSWIACFVLLAAVFFNVAVESFSLPSSALISSPLLLLSSCCLLLANGLDTIPTINGPYVHLPRPGHRSFVLEREVFALRCYSPNDENIFYKGEAEVKLIKNDSSSPHIQTFRVEDDAPPEEPYRHDARFYTSLQVYSAHANHSGSYMCQTQDAVTRDDEFLYEWTISVIGQHSLMAQNVTYRKSRLSPNVTLTCVSLAGQFLPVEWAKDGLAIPLGSGNLNQRYRYELQGGNLTIIDAYKLSAGEHTFECRINAHALQAATQTTQHTLRTMSMPVKLKVLPKASGKWDSVISSADDNAEYRTAVVHVADIMQSDAQAQRVDAEQQRSEVHDKLAPHRAEHSSIVKGHTSFHNNNDENNNVDEERLADESKTSQKIRSVEAASDSSSSTSVIRYSQWCYSLIVIFSMTLKTLLYIC